MPNFIQITPFMHVPDVEAAVAFFRDVLGFEPLWREADYAYVEREGCGIRMLQNERAAAPKGADAGVRGTSAHAHGDDGAPAGNRRFCYYVDVRDVDALYEALKPKLDALPPGDVHGPADKPYNQRELLVLAPDGNLIAFGQALRR